MDNTCVELKSAYLFLVGGAGELHSYLNVTVKVKNIAYRKDVQIHYRRRLRSVWEDAPLKWSANYGDYDLFILEHPLDFGSDPFVEFVIKYTSAGRQYWDNNDFTNYHLFADTNTLISSKNVMLNSAELIWGGVAGSHYITGVQGEILVSNLSYHKKVGIRYSVDDWRSYFDLDACFKKTLCSTTEIWSFGMNITPQGFGRGKFAAYYQNIETGQFNWDNNFVQNYDLRNQYKLE